MALLCSADRSMRRLRAIVGYARSRSSSPRRRSAPARRRRHRRARPRSRRPGNQASLSARASLAVRRGALPIAVLARTMTFPAGDAPGRSPRRASVARAAVRARPGEFMAAGMMGTAAARASHYGPCDLSPPRYGSACAAVDVVGPEVRDLRPPRPTPYATLSAARYLMPAASRSRPTSSPLITSGSFLGRGAKTSLHNLSGRSSVMPNRKRSADTVPFIMDSPAPCSRWWTWKRRTSCQSRCPASAPGTPQRRGRGRQSRAGSATSSRASPCRRASADAAG